MPGQLELRGSDVRIWSGSNTVQHRDGLYLNRWRVYDPRVGQYLQPDPAAIGGELHMQHPFAYVGVAPADGVDPDGRLRVDWLRDLWRPVDRIFDDVFDDIPDWAHDVATADPFVGDQANPGCRHPSQDTAQDALRHCLWQCAMTHEYGHQLAFWAGVGHEIGPNNWREFEMDMHNNRMGQTIGSLPELQDRQACVVACEGRSTGLVTLRNPADPLLPAPAIPWSR